MTKIFPTGKAVMALFCLTAAAGFVSPALSAAPAATGAMSSRTAAPTKVPRYGRFEASWTIAGQTGNPFDPQQNDAMATFTGPAGLHSRVPAFWDGDCWRVRFAPTQAGHYTLALTFNGQPIHPKDLSADAFQCLAGSDPGFVRHDAKTTQRFVFDNGQTYYPLGINVAWINSADPGYPSYFASMDQAHLNWARVWMNYWDGKNLDWAPEGKENPKRGYLLLDVARKWDGILDQATQHGVYVQMTLQHHGQYTNQVDPNWVKNPWNVANGGFLAHPDDFFTDPEAKRLTKAKYRYIVARWGYATHLLSFELFNEVQNIREVESHFQDVVQWHREMAAYLRSLDVDHHLVTTSNSVPGEPLSQIGLDYDQIHTYPPDIVTTFAATQTTNWHTPAFYGEWGPPNAPPAEAVKLVHDGLWAGMMIPAAGASQYWYWDKVSSQNWWPQFASAGGFVRTFGMPQQETMTTLRPDVQAEGPRGDLAFAPPGDWGPTTRTEITLPSDGSLPNLSGISSYIQGTSHRDLLAQPIVFHLNVVTPCRFEVQIGSVSKQGAHPTVSVDGGPAQELDFPASAADRTSGQVIGAALTPGTHTVSLFNTGPDWFVARQIKITKYAPAVAALAKGNAHTAVFWAYDRDRDALTPHRTMLSFANFAPGIYRVRLWDTAAGKPGPSFVARARSGSSLSVPLSSLTGDVAGIIQPVSSMTKRK